MVLNWDGKTISGMVNPGTDNMPIKTATLTPEGWVVKFQFDGKDAKGAAVSYTLDGKIENLPFTNRSITGTWKSATESGKFKLVRQ